jgi:hypothetical protein
MKLRSGPRAKKRLRTTDLDFVAKGEQDNPVSVKKNFSKQRSWTALSSGI